MKKFSSVVLSLLIILSLLAQAKFSLRAEDFKEQDFSKKQHTITIRKSNNLVFNRNLLMELPAPSEKFKELLEEDEDYFDPRDFSALCLKVPHLTAGLEAAKELNEIFDDLAERISEAYLEASLEELSLLHADWSIAFPADDFFVISTEFRKAGSGPYWDYESHSYIVNTLEDELYTLREFLGELGISLDEFKLQTERGIIDTYQYYRDPLLNYNLRNRSLAAKLLEQFWSYDFDDYENCLLWGDEFDRFSLRLPMNEGGVTNTYHLPLFQFHDLRYRDYALNPDYIYLANEIPEIAEEQPEALIIPLPNVREEGDLDFLLASLDSFRTLSPAGDFLEDLSVLSNFFADQPGFLGFGPADYYLIVPRNRHAVIKLDLADQGADELQDSAAVGSSLLRLALEEEAEFELITADESLSFKLAGRSLEDRGPLLDDPGLDEDLRFTPELNQYDGILNPGAFGQESLDFIEKRDLRAELSPEALAVYEAEFVLQALVLPSLDLDSPEAEDFNEELDQLASRLIDEIEADPETERYITANYLVNRYGDLLSLVVFYKLGGAEAEDEYLIFNYDLEEEERLDDEGLLAYLALNAEDEIAFWPRFDLDRAKLQFAEQESFARRGNYYIVAEHFQQLRQPLRNYGALSTLLNRPFKELAEPHEQSSSRYYQEDNRLFIDVSQGLAHLARYAAPTAQAYSLRAESLEPEMISLAQPESAFFRQVYAELADLFLAQDHSWPGFSGEAISAEGNPKFEAYWDLSSVSAFFIDLGEVESKGDLVRLMKDLENFRLSLSYKQMESPAEFECLNFSQNLEEIEAESVGQNFYLIIPRDRSASLLLEQSENAGLGDAASGLIVLAYAGELSEDSAYKVILRQSFAEDYELELPLEEEASFVDATMLYELVKKFNEQFYPELYELPEDAESSIDYNYYVPFMRKDWLDEYLR